MANRLLEAFDRNYWQPDETRSPRCRLPRTNWRTRWRV
jgi:hypothetical protein